MKLIIQIPCFNEEATLTQTVRDLPREIRGVDAIEFQVIDDGSSDRTSDLAVSLGVKHLIRFKQNRGLAAAFKAGVDHALLEGADLLVNTDADNQYQGQDISKLVEPIINGKADIVIGTRPIDSHPDFGPIKKLLQKLGSKVLRLASSTDVKDAASGFRAYSREALLHINVFSDFSYCMETLIQAGYNNLKIETVDIRVNSKTRESRLFKNVFQYIWKSGKTIVNIFILYRAHLFFGILSLACFLAAFALIARYAVLVLFDYSRASSFWPSIILAGSFLLAGFVSYMTGILSSLVGANRKLSEEVLYRLRKLESQTTQNKK